MEEALPGISGPGTEWFTLEILLFKLVGSFVIWIKIKSTGSWFKIFYITIIKEMKYKAF